jgi:hypothetical protein
MIELVSSPAPAEHPAEVGRGGSAGSTVFVLAGDAHSHSWRRLPETVGLFCCAGAGCQWFAVCPACLGSLDVALQLRDGIDGVALYWCPAHSACEEGAS